MLIYSIKLRFFAHFLPCIACLENVFQQPASGRGAVFVRFCLVLCLAFWLKFCLTFLSERCSGAASATGFPGHATRPSLGAWSPTSMSATSRRPVALSAVRTWKIGELRKLETRE